ncbi:hypothetical protein [Brucella pituitosa]|uniref:hypothetical protein n=1 Tax=Brucella pituitosa TaxID=571256 RepID=UPI0009A1D884|nr:hypothetical protein [Brucella pituitosa]
MARKSAKVVQDSVAAHQFFAAQTVYGQKSSRKSIMAEIIMRQALSHWKKSPGTSPNVTGLRTWA